jgi:hypothetical protein
MLKTVVLLILLVSAFTQLTDKQKLQFGLDGAFVQNGLAPPTTIINCFDDASAAATIAYISASFDQAAQANLADLISLIPTMPIFGHSLPSSVKSCLAGNP